MEDLTQTEILGIMYNNDDELKRKEKRQEELEYGMHEIKGIPYRSNPKANTDMMELNRSTVAAAIDGKIMLPPGTTLTDLIKSAELNNDQLGNGNTVFSYAAGPNTNISGRRGGLTR